MHLDLQRLLNYLLLGLIVCIGVVAGLLTAQWLKLSLSDTATSVPQKFSGEIEGQGLQPQDFQIIVDRNLFNSQAVGSGSQVDLTLAGKKSSPAAKAWSLSKVSLIGTLVAGEQSLALLQIAGKTEIHRLGAKLASGVELVEIARHRVVISDQGVRRELLFKDAASKPQAEPEPGGKPGSGIVASGNNRWQISRAAAENARANFNRLLRSARVIPQLQNGQTVGFKLVEMERGSLLEQIGLKVGDLLVEINQVKLDSPEKALQVFQQLRDASNISLGLVRNGKRENFQYYLD